MVCVLYRAFNLHDMMHDFLFKRFGVQVRVRRSMPGLTTFTLSQYRAAVLLADTPLVPRDRAERQREPTLHFRIISPSVAEWGFNVTLLERRSTRNQIESQGLACFEGPRLGSEPPCQQWREGPRFANRKRQVSQP